MATETATRLGLGNKCFDRDVAHTTPPGRVLIKNSEELYGLWFFSSLNLHEWTIHDSRWDVGVPDDMGFRTFPAKAAYGAYNATIRWMVVVLSSLVEAYAKDSLRFAAKCDSSPSVLRASLDWRNLKSPEEWIQAFEQIGVSGFQQGLAGTLDEMLGIRHLVVHSGSLVDTRYLERRPQSRYKLGDEIELTYEELTSFISATFEFFAPIEAHLVRAYVANNSLP